MKISEFLLFLSGNFIRVNFFQWTDEQEAALKAPIIASFEKEGSPYFSSARQVLIIIYFFLEEIKVTPL